MGDLTFYGPDMTIDTTQPITVVTQFITSDGSDTGTLSEIRRFYVQNGAMVPNSQSTIAGVDGNSITDDFCEAQKTAFGDTNTFASLGGLAQLGKAFEQGMVLVLSIWDDYAASMLWLDSSYPTNKDPSAPGVTRGTCATTSGVPAQVEAQVPNSQVVFSNIKFGDIGSTFKAGQSSGGGGGGGSGTTTPPSQPTGGNGGTVAQWGQCGGIGYTGPTTRASGFTCHVLNSCE